MIHDLWYKNAVVYSLDVETYLDANGDGCGDFEGLSRRLDYLDSLGVDAIWLAPFQPSPRRDAGYDVSDYYGVDPRFGSGGDFVEFMREADSRGIRVLIDLVVNHTSDRHPWFRAARDRASPLHDWYVWSKKRPADWRSGVVFPGSQKGTWTFDSRAREYFFHRFYGFQPDLDMDNPRVREEVRRIMGFWLELGVAGFRVDAVPFVLEKPPRGRSKRQIHFEYLREFRDFLQWRVGDAVLLGEANVTPDESRSYFADGDGLHMMFDFWVNQHLFLALATADARPLAAALQATRSLPPTAQWAQFLRNHDELDLGRLSAPDRARVFEAFGPEPAMQLYDRGIRRRPAPMLGDLRRLQLAYSLVLSLPGTPVLRYGDEIGMGEDLRLKERAAIRTPMQWSAEPNGGFSTAGSVVRPVIARGIYGYERVNVEEQQRDPDSLLRWTARMIQLRKQCPEIGWGEWRIVSSRAPSVLALEYRWRGSTIVCVHNLADAPVEARLALGGGTLANLLDAEDVESDASGAHRVTLDAFGYRWFRLGEVSQALAREVVD
ncbi:MAG TPA: alpha-amylase family protein [Gaiellaceae bacterium]|jgi:maltose alpha-D-glucosyltransferase/alpha-amylase|nr:alpha-amylase family protein [Gaiellaceae bacterium]